MLSALALSGCADDIDCPTCGGEVPEEDEMAEILQREREAVTVLCGTLGGEYWLEEYDELGYADKPVGEWEGVRTDESGRVDSLYILCFSFSELSKQIGVLEHLKVIHITGTSAGKVKGELPAEIANCRNLEKLIMYNNAITKLPGELSECRKLRFIDLNDNYITEIPEGLVHDGLEYLDLSNNKLTGPVPAQITDNERLWRHSWGDILYGNEFDTSGLDIPAPDFELEDIDGNLINSAEEYAKHKLTVFLQWNGGAQTMDKVKIMMELHEKYEGLNVIGLCNYSGEEVTIEYIKYIKSFGMPWRNMFEAVRMRGEHIDYEYVSGYPVNAYNPFVVMVNSEGTVVFQNDMKQPEEFSEFIRQYFGDLPDDPEKPDDPDDPDVPDEPSIPDGTVMQLQAATEGAGIDIVLMGDAFSAESINDGTYKKVMDGVKDAFFSVEPFRTFRNLFNVNAVVAVSDSNGYDTEGSTTFSTWFGDGTIVGGDHSKVMEYAQKVVPEERLDKTLIIVLMNNYAYSGTTYLYSTSEGDYGNGAAIAYLTRNTDPVKFTGLLNHEANGHGFAKLGDEYAYEENGMVLQDIIDDVKRKERFGWYRNIDFTSDPSAVKWSHIISDPLYVNDGVGVFEGALTYWRGVWKPSLSGVMRYNNGEFNAPSREAIYYRIHKLAYGEDWQYDYADFVDYDVINRAPLTRTSLKRPHDFIPTAEPVVYDHSWRVK